MILGRQSGCIGEKLRPCCRAAPPAEGGEGGAAPPSDFRVGPRALSIRQVSELSQLQPGRLGEPGPGY